MCCQVLTDDAESYSSEMKARYVFLVSKRDNMAVEQLRRVVHANIFSMKTCTAQVVMGPGACHLTLITVSIINTIIRLGTCNRFYPWHVFICFAEASILCLDRNATSGSIQCVPQNPIRNITYIIQSSQLYLDPSELASSVGLWQSPCQIRKTFIRYILARKLMPPNSFWFIFGIFNPNAPPSRSSSSGRK